MSERILVVDDSKVNRVVASAKLKEAKFKIATAEDGTEALTILDLLDGPPDDLNCSFDAVLLDVMMPGIDGFTVLERIRKVWNPIQLPVLITTAKDEPEDIIHALELGANDYLSKPLNLQILLARLKTHLKVKTSHAALKKAQLSLVSAAKIESIGLLAAGVAHEIRNPLGRIQMAGSGLAGMVDSLPEEDREMAKLLTDTIEESVTEADTIVKHLMKASQNQQLLLTECNLNHVIRKTLSSLKVEIEEAGVKLFADLATHTPPVLLAAEEFCQALTAVIQNSVQAMKIKGGASRNLTVRTGVTELSGIGSKEGGRSGNRPRDGDPVVAIHVEDDGPGMKKDDLPLAFDAFFTTKATGAGTGLGLTVAQKIVELHKGTIQVENRETGGLRTSIFLKVAGGLRTHV